MRVLRWAKDVIDGLLQTTCVLFERSYDEVVLIFGYSILQARDWIHILPKHYSLCKGGTIGVSLLWSIRNPDDFAHIFKKEH